MGRDERIVAPHRHSHLENLVKILSLHVLAALDAAASTPEPTAADLDAIEAEMPVISAEVELLDTQISLLDTPRTAWADRRLRRAHRRVLEARTAATRRSAESVLGGEVA
ncbi:DUF6284 family protein [Streptomyces sp. AJS327]|uniref:DUF6284 family protein n=1 Tax=Streptomyces sp. AJS327 TaxID=2545265 RepID=UPI0035B56953